MSHGPQYKFDYIQTFQLHAVLVLEIKTNINKWLELKLMTI